MQFLFPLLLCAQSFISVFASNISSDTWIRGPNMIHYSVFPIDSTQTNETSKTETLLKELCGDANVVPVLHDDNQENHLIDSWIVTLKDSDPVTVLSDLEGVRHVERNNADWNSFPDSEPGKLLRRDNGEYIVLVKDGSDTKKAEEFLMTKIQKGTSLYQIMLRDEILGWGGAVLDADAKAAVENYDAVKGLMEDAEMDDDGKFEDDDQSVVADGRPLSKPERQHFSCLVKEGSDIQKTEEFLESKVQKGCLYHQLKSDGKVIGWWRLVLDDDAKKAVEDYEDIDHFKVGGTKLMNLQASAANNCPSPKPKHSELTTRDVQLYNAMASNRSDTKKTEEYLRSKVQRPDDILQHTWGDDVSGWYNLALDPEAKKAVEAHEGIDDVQLMKKWVAFGSLPAKDPIPSKPERTEPVRRDLDIYIALATNTSDVQKTEEFLKSKVQNGEPMYQFKRDNTVIGWYNLVLDPAARKAVQEYEGIETIRVEGKLQEFRALSASDMAKIPRNTNRTSEKKKNALLSRNQNWEKQVKADKALVMDSQFPTADLDKLADFVHVSEPGKDSFVYVFDRGVELAAVNKAKTEYEFRPPGGFPDRIQVLQTKRSSNKNQDPLADDSGKSHGTAVASKAIGSQFGLAKSATLISVKMDLREGDFQDAFELVIQDLKAHPGRAHQSVILITLGSEEPSSYRDSKGDPIARMIFENPIKELLGLGVPIICAAGNEGDKPNRHNIDARPAVYQDEDIPLINVGATNYKGERLSMSQYGSQLTVYAPGFSVEAQSASDLETITATGTSIAAPQVAGLIATYLSYKNKPWDDSKQGIERVKAIKEYLVSDRSSWERSPGVKMIWNGAAKEDHESAGANGLSSPPPPPPLPPAPTKALSIILQSRSQTPVGAPYQKAINENQWLFFTTTPGVGVVCKAEFNAIHKEKIKDDSKSLVDNPPWPGGTFSLKVDGMKCNYMNNGRNPGALWCDGRKDPIACYEDGGKSSRKGTVCNGGDFATTQHAVAYCDW